MRTDAARECLALSGGRFDGQDKKPFEYWRGATAGLGVGVGVVAVVLLLIIAIHLCHNRNQKYASSSSNGGRVSNSAVTQVQGTSQPV